MQNIAGVKNKLVPITLAMALACTFALAGCSGSGDGDDEGLTGGVAATVNGTEIPEDEVTTYIQNIREQQGATSDADWATYLNSIGYTPESVRDVVLDMYITQELEKEAAADEGIEITDEDVDEAVQPMRDNYDSDEAFQEALASAGYTEESYRTLVRQSLLTEQLEDKVLSDDEKTADDETVLSYVQMYAPAFDGMKRSSHILFSSDDEDTAKEVLQKIKDGADFAEMAKEYSTDDGSKDNGGDVGWEGLGNSFVTAYSDALDELDKGETSDLVTSEYGIHIIRCTDVWNAPDTIDSLDDVPEEMVEAVRTQMADPAAEQTAFNNYLQDLEDKADIQKSEMPSDVPYNVDMSQYISSSAAATEDGVAEEAESSSSAEGDGSSSTEGDASATTTIEVEGDEDSEATSSSSDEAAAESSAESGE